MKEFKLLTIAEIEEQFFNPESGDTFEERMIELESVEGTPHDSCGLDSTEFIGPKDIISEIHKCAIAHGIHGEISEDYSSNEQNYNFTVHDMFSEEEQIWSFSAASFWHENLNH